MEFIEKYIAKISQHFILRHYYNLIIFNCFRKPTDLFHILTHRAFCKVFISVFFFGIFVYRWMRKRFYNFEIWVLRNTSSQTAQSITEVFHSNVISQQEISNRFAKFRSGNFPHTNVQRNRPETKMDSDELEATIESVPSRLSMDFLYYLVLTSI